MKSQNSTEPILSFQPLGNQPSVVSNISLLKCINNSQAHCICVNSICLQNNAIMCTDIKCKCRKIHDFCIIAQLQSIIKSVETHAKPLKHFEDKINLFFQNIIDKISIIRDDLIQKHRQLFQKKSYSPNQIQLLTLLSSNSLKQINGAMVAQIALKINERETIDKMIKTSQEELQKTCTKMQNVINSLSSQMEKILMRLQRQFTTATHFKTSHLNQPYFFTSSNIITTHQHQTTLHQFFSNETILQTSLLYRASQHQFKGEIFHKLCQDIPNILVLVKTSFGKLIGGYTPLGFSSTQRDIYLNDPKMGSFLFSITEGDKLVMKSQQNAIMNEKDSDYVLRFGGGSDLRIANHADQNVLSYAAISTTYKNQKYISNTDSYRKFTGSDTIYFKISEWEVWKLTLI